MAPPNGPPHLLWLPSRHLRPWAWDAVLASSSGSTTPGEHRARSQAGWRKLVGSATRPPLLTRWSAALGRARGRRQASPICGSCYKRLLQPPVGGAQSGRLRQMVPTGWLTAGLLLASAGSTVSWKQKHGLEKPRPSALRSLLSHSNEWSKVSQTMKPNEMSDRRPCRSRGTLERVAGSCICSSMT
jgi:hypothetical protein